MAGHYYNFIAEYAATPSFHHTMAVGLWPVNISGMLRHNLQYWKPEPEHTSVIG